MKLRPYRLVVSFAGSLLAVWASDSPAETSNAEGTAYFETHIRPVLIERCYECHSEEAGKRKGGLWLDRRAGWAAGGDSGPALVPGAPEESLLIRAIRYHDPELEMPPKGALPPEVVSRFETWVARGAPDPRNAAVEADPEPRHLVQADRLWSLRPLGDPPAPTPRDSAWSMDPLDDFIRSRLKDAGLEPALDAAPEDLLRRLHHDLAGLPPPVDLQERFLADPSPEHFARIVEDLLESRAFAERWGRHWLDISRYADSSGGGRAIPLPDAWRFRDYVIDAFHEDRPLDQIIREHIAGDLMEADSREERERQLVATGFLVLGPHNYENQDKELLDLEIVDEQLDTIGRAFLGMTIGCARCHDHKFDPIPARDYYALAGILTSTRSVVHSNVSKWYTSPLPTTPEAEARIEAARREIESIGKRLGEVEAELARWGRIPGGNTASVHSAGLPGIVVDDISASREGEWLASTSNRHWVDAGYIHDQSAGRGSKHVTYAVPIEEAGRYEVRISYSAGSNRSTRVPVMIKHEGGEAELRVNQRMRPAHDGLFHSLGMFRFGAGEATVRISNTGTDDGVVIADAVQFLPEGGGPVPATEEPPAGLVQALEEERAGLNRELKRLQGEAARAPTVMRVAEAGEPADTAIRVRGVARNLGEVVPRGVLQAASWDEVRRPIAAGSGRLEMATWITSPRNPLTARVLANRVWLHLFGQGIVGSPDNFGMTGGPPTHPLLLDHLAQRLIAGGWSTKTLVRDIVHSRSYRMSTRPRPETARLAGTVDPENLLLWRSHRRRVDAETLRDTILTVAGQLDGTPGGPALPDGFKSELGYRFTSLRRSVYLPRFRNSPHEMFQVFDAANPNFVVGKRVASSIPTQALFLTNSPFVHEMSAAAAERLLREGDSIPARLERIHREILGRRPLPAEWDLALAYLEARGPERPEAWAGWIRNLIASLDFQYVP